MVTLTRAMIVVVSEKCVNMYAYQGLPHSVGGRGVREGLENTSLGPSYSHGLPRAASFEP